MPINNCSNDGTTEFIKDQYKDKLSHVIHSKNFGPKKNFDLCISYARNEYTCIYHSDDKYDAKILEKQVDFLDKNHEVAAVFCLAKFINGKGRVVGWQKLNFIETDSSFGIIQLLNLILTNHNFLICPSLMIRTNVLKELQCWDWFYKSSADLEMWLRISEKYKIGIINDHLISYRISKNQWSEKIRKSSSKADFFIVTKLYINLYKQYITKKSLNDYLNLIIKDYIVRIKNCRNEERKSKLTRLFIKTLTIYKTSFYRKIFFFILMAFVNIWKVN
jgi:hypothetical protein